LKVKTYFSNPAVIAKKDSGGRSARGALQRAHKHTLKQFKNIILSRNFNHNMPIGLYLLETLPPDPEFYPTSVCNNFWCFI